MPDATAAAALVRQAASGDQVAFARLVAEHHPAMMRVAYVIAGNADTAGDAVQSAWTIAWRRLSSLRDGGHIHAWLVAIAANEARMALRRERRTNVVDISTFEDQLGRHEPVDAIPLIDLKRAVSRLGPDDRTLLALRYVAGLDSSEIAIHLGISGWCSQPAFAAARTAAPGPGTGSGGATMNDRSAFESRLGDALRRYADEAPVEVDAMSAAAAIASERRPGLLGWTAPLVLSRTRLLPLVVLLILTLLAFAIALVVLSRPQATLRAGLAFVSDGDVYLAASDGRSRTLILDSTSIDFDSVTWVAGGRELAVEAPDLAATIEVAGKHDQRASRTTALRAWAPDGRRYAFVQSGAKAPGGHALVIFDLDTGTRGELSATDGNDHVTGLWPHSWSPDGRWLAVGLDGGKLGIADALSGVVSGESPQLFAEDVAWSPDSSRLAYSSDVGIWVIDIATRSSRHIVDAAVHAGSFPNGWRHLGPLPLPMWSPDGSRIAFRAAPGLAVIGPDGADRRDIVPGPVGRFDWVSEARSIAYVLLQAQDAANGELAIVDLATGVTHPTGVGGVSSLTGLDVPPGAIPESSWPDRPVVFMPAP